MMNSLVWSGEGDGQASSFCCSRYIGSMDETIASCGELLGGWPWTKFGRYYYRHAFSDIYTGAVR